MILKMAKKFSSLLGIYEYHRIEKELIFRISKYIFKIEIFSVK